MGIKILVWQASGMEVGQDDSDIVRGLDRLTESEASEQPTDET